MKKNNILGWILRYFIQGILMLGPLVTTIWIIWTVFYSIDSLIPNVSKEYPGLVFGVIIIATTITGFFGSKFLLGKFLINTIDYLLKRTPSIRFLYSPLATAAAIARLRTLIAYPVQGPNRAHIFYKQLKGEPHTIVRSAFCQSRPWPNNSRLT